jgi:Head domain of trimeric autotransporter adhesin
MKKCFFIVLTALTAQLKAQNVGIGTTTPLARLHVDSSVLFTGLADLPASPADPPISGTGSRMMWYSEKAAFRAGAVFGASWDKINIGNYSFAAGYNAKAVGVSSVATGHATTASGDYATATGYFTSAIAQHATALGSYTFASGNAALAVGSESTATGFASTAMGNNVIAKARNGVSAGSYNDNTDSPLPSSDAPQDRILQIGNGNSITRSNALTVLRNGNTGIGVLDPSEKLEVAGKIKSTALQVVSGAAVGKVLTADALGNASWQTPANASANTGIEVSTFASQIVSSGVISKVIFDTKYTDPSIAFNTINSEWTVPSSGFYHINAALSFFTMLPANTDVNMYLKVNGSDIKQKSAKITGQSTIDLSGDIALAVNDKVAVHILQNSGAAATLINGRTFIYLSGFKVY